MKKLSHGQPEGPVSVRMSAELQKQLDFCADKTGMKVTDLMRLCMRIGMEHFKRINYDTAKCIVDCVEHHQQPKTNIESLEHRPWLQTRTPASTVDSNMPSPMSAPITASATNAKPPPPHVAVLNEAAQSPPITEERDAAAMYKQTRRRKA